MPFHDHVVAMPSNRKFWKVGSHNTEGARLKAELFADFIQANFELLR